MSSRERRVCSCGFEDGFGIRECEVCSRVDNFDEELGRSSNKLLSKTSERVLGKAQLEIQSSVESSSSQKCLVLLSQRTARGGRVEIRGRMVQVVDTPGLFDTEMNNEEVTMEILKCVGISAPGPHAILLVVRVGRFTDEERETVRLLQKAFGDNMTKYLIVVFTGKDTLDHESKSISQIVQEGPKCIKEFLDECDNRYIALNNNANNATRKAQTEHLLTMIDDVVRKNGGDFYKSSVFDEADKIIRERIIQKKTEHRNEMAKFRRQISEEYHEPDRRKKEYMDFVYRRQDNTQSTQLWSPREEVRNEIEKGDTTIMKKVWKNIRKAGIEVWGRFRSLYETLKRKASSY
ncbi:hypothetical protein FSP39_020749 [Pinctada imbricata]|uniref:AIG1-type G domain-containing protein n=1 Tax=Pinctada imbricata TaxID=66713 RepID=A0AA89C0P3_PINIB|nr:hypothetical protein FSP39_020749 [Pinctada imbricata]